MQGAPAWQAENLGERLLLRGDPPTSTTTIATATKQSRLHPIAGRFKATRIPGRFGEACWGFAMGCLPWLAVQARDVDPSEVCACITRTKL